MSESMMHRMGVWQGQETGTCVQTFRLSMMLSSRGPSTSVFITCAWSSSSCFGASLDTPVK
jgi:hypothetical protein